MLQAGVRMHFIVPSVEFAKATFDGGLVHEVARVDRMGLDGGEVGFDERIVIRRAVAG